MHVLIAGASGLIGAALHQRLTATGHTVSTLGRAVAAEGTSAHHWDPVAGVFDNACLDGVEAVVNLAGAGIGDRRWSDAYKRTLRESHIRSTALLAEAIAERNDPPGVFLNGSAIGVYGDRGDELLTESSRPGSGFLAELVVDWEAATRPAERAGVRIVHLRSGVVLSALGGALRKQLPLFKFGLGGRFGSGRHWQSWITIDDEVAAIVHLLTADVSGPVNLTAPNPVTNAAFTKALATVLRRPALLPIPKFGPAALLGSELAESLLYSGQRVQPERLLGAGFEFGDPSIEPALRRLLDR